MDVEGKGKCPPAPIDISIKPCTMVELELLAKDRERRRGYSRATGWRGGLITGDMRTWYASSTLYGCVGEKAVAILANRRLPELNLDVDAVDRPSGDGGKDFVVYGATVQVKARRRRSGLCLVRRCNDYGTILQLTWNFCVFTTWNCKHDCNGPWLTQHVTVDGWIGKNHLREIGVYEPARKGSHKNLRIRDSELLHTDDLFKYLRTLRR